MVDEMSAGKAAAAEENAAGPLDADDWVTVAKRHAAATATPVAAPKTDAPTEAAAGAAPAVDAPAASAAPEAPSPEAPPPDKAAKAWAEIKRQRAELKSEVARLRGETARMAADRAELDELRNLTKSDPHKAAEKLGLTFRDLATRALADQAESKLTPEQREIRDLRARIEAREVAEREAVQARSVGQQADAEREAKKQIAAEFSTVAVDYPLSGALDESELSDRVWSVMVRHREAVERAIAGAASRAEGEALAIRKGLATVEAGLAKDLDRLSRARAKSAAAAPDGANGARGNAGSQRAKPEGREMDARRSVSNRDAASPSADGTPVHETATAARRRAASLLRLTER